MNRIDRPLQLLRIQLVEMYVYNRNASPRLKTMLSCMSITVPKMVILKRNLLCAFIIMLPLKDMLLDRRFQ